MRRCQFMSLAIVLAVACCADTRPVHAGGPQIDAAVMRGCDNDTRAIAYYATSFSAGLCGVNASVRLHQEVASPFFGPFNYWAVTAAAGAMDGQSFAANVRREGRGRTTEGRYTADRERRRGTLALDAGHVFRLGPLTVIPTLGLSANYVDDRTELTSTLTLSGPIGPSQITSASGTEVMRRAAVGVNAGLRLTLPLTSVLSLTADGALGREWARSKGSTPVLLESASTIGANLDDLFSTPRGRTDARVISGSLGLNWSPFGRDAMLVEAGFQWSKIKAVDMVLNAQLLGQATNMDASGPYVRVGVPLRW